MSWRFRKIFQFGPVRTSISKRGVGASWGVPGFRIGVSPDGRKYVSIGMPGTGLYFIKYLSGAQPKQTQLPNQQKQTKATYNNNSNSKEPWWKQKHL